MARRGDMIWVLTITYVHDVPQLRVDVVANTASANKDVVDNAAWKIGARLQEDGYIFTDEIYTGGETTRYYEDIAGRHAIVKITKMWLN